MSQKTKCLNKKCEYKSTTEDLIESEKVEFDIYDRAIQRIKHKKIVYLLCSKCNHSHYYFEENKIIDK